MTPTSTMRPATTKAITRFLEIAASRLQAGGLFRIATDHPDYGRELDTLVETVPTLERLDWGEHAPPAPTNYEIKYVREGRPIWRFLLRRRGAAGT